ncbi:uncharacterized protein [Cicer arietinum]|uniref:Uncharacterized protein LOC101493903 n=1 Tax=Cicer arietinum TaxID=3827 RepID=A0A1S2XI72_CICAR|nr:uncharacterized protein LOC101493903 [Cicer arietinum]
MTYPFFMNPNDNPGIALVSTPLNNTNFHTWSCAMLVSLCSKNKPGFVLDTISCPKDTYRLLMVWDQCNTIVMSWITNSLEPDIAQSIMWMDSAADIWHELNDRYHQGDELENFLPLPSCSCTNTCTCNLFPKIWEYRENDYGIRFLKGLNEQYSSVRSYIMLMEHLPTINKVFSMLIQQECKFFSHTEELKTVAAVSNSSRGFGRGSFLGSGRGFDGGGRGFKICTHYNKLVDVCFKKHGYPPNYPQSNSDDSKNCSATSLDIEDALVPNNSNSSSLDNATQVFTLDQLKASLALL